MKKFIIIVFFGFLLAGCELPLTSSVTTTGTATTANAGSTSGTAATTVTTTAGTVASTIDQATLNSITQQIMDTLRQQIQQEYDQKLTSYELAVIDVANTEGPSVLGVSNFQDVNGVMTEVATGSGVVYKVENNNQYYLITNEHVIDGAAEVKVVMPDQSYIDATVVGSDTQSDLAVLKFTYNGYIPTVTFGDSSKLQVGQLAIAIGNPLGYNYYGSVTAGVISKLSTNVPIDYNNDGVVDWTSSLILHTAPINPGNSGGGLFNSAGELIGINNMKIVETGTDNMGFAIPINTVKTIVAQLEQYGQVVRPALGITAIGVPDIIKDVALGATGLPTLPNGVTTGVYVESVLSGGSADGKLQAGDIITNFNGTAINTFNDLSTALAAANVGDTVNIQVLRNGQTVTVSVTLQAKQLPTSSTTANSSN